MKKTKQRGYWTWSNQDTEQRNEKYNAAHRHRRDVALISRPTLSSRRDVFPFLGPVIGHRQFSQNVFSISVIGSLPQSLGSPVNPILYKTEL